MIPEPQPHIDKWELDRVAFDIYKTRAERYLELGARCGGSLFENAKVIKIPGLLVTIDLPNSKWGEKGSEKSLQYVHKKLQEKGYITQNIIGNSRDPEIIQKIKSMKVKFDVLLIDGDHTPEGVQADINNYVPMVSKGGIVIFHDCGFCQGVHSSHKEGQETREGVHKVFKKFAQGKKSVIYQHTWGLGVVWV